MSQTPVEVRKEPEGITFENEEVLEPGPDGDPDPGQVDMVTKKQESNPHSMIQPNQEVKTEIKKEPKSEDYQKLLDYGLDMRVAEIYQTGYTLDVTAGQRKYGGPPPNWESEAPGSGCEIFCGKIPRDVYEDELVPLFEQCGRIWDLRLMMDPRTGLNRGYAFVTFADRETASSAVRKLNGHMIREGKDLKISMCNPRTRLFIGNIPKTKGRGDIEEEFQKLGAGLKEVIIYCSPDNKMKNRGFCFLEYESSKAASLAKRRLEKGQIKVWNCDVIVDWADPQEEPDAEIMAQVKVLYVRNLTSSVTEEELRETFEHYGKVERVKKIKDYAFIHFDDRKHAENAMKSLNEKELGGSKIEISIAKPPSDKKKKEEILRKREQRMIKSVMHQSMAPPPFPLSYGQGHVDYPGGDSAAGLMYYANQGIIKAGGGGAPVGMRGGWDFQQDYNNNGCNVTPPLFFF